MNQTKRERTLKDLLFLSEIPAQELDPNAIKRTVKEGTGQVLGKIIVPYDVYISYDKFDYEGKILNTLHYVKAKLPLNPPTQNIPLGVSLAIKSMKLDQTAWVNARCYDMHLTQNVPEGGCHFFIKIEEIKYKDQETLQAKRLVVSRNRQEGKKLFTRKEYGEAMKRYKNIIHISEGFNLKKFTKEEISQLETINIAAKRNFMKCFCKIKRPDRKTISQAEQYTNLFWKLEGETEETLYFKGYTLMHARFLTDAMQISRKLYTFNQVQGQKLFDIVKLWKKTKLC